MIKQLQKTDTFRKLVLLISIFLVGFVSLFILNQVFVQLTNKLDKQTENLQAKIAISELVAHDVLTIRSLFNELATTTSSRRSREFVKKDIQEAIQSIHKALDVLQNGGVLKQKILLNISGYLTTTKVITYHKDTKQEFSIEMIHIAPKLNDIMSMLNEVEKMLEKKTQYQRGDDIKKYQAIDRKIRRYYKALPTFFGRMTENIRELLYDANKQLAQLKQKNIKEKQKYFWLKLILMLIIILIVLILGYLIAKNIQKSNQKLNELNNKLIKNIHELDKQKKAIRVVLDAQPNIVVVNYNGSLHDANRYFFEFFGEFQTVQEFHKKYDCICATFEKDVPNETEYIQKSKYGTLQWFEYIIAHPEIDFKVLIAKHDKTLHHFAIQVAQTTLDKSDNDLITIISLHDITHEIDNQMQLKKLNENLEEIVEQKTKELTNLNKNLKKRVLEESQKVREKDQMMMQQAKLASMGEMIGNIAHQWRQPLSVITTSVSGIQVKAEMGLEVTNQEINQTAQLVVQQAQYLSDTIDHFRNFVKGDVTFGNISIKATLENTLSLVEATLNNNYIELIQTIEDDLIIQGNINELTEAFINIINNSKDALKEQDDIEKRYLFLSTKKRDENTLEIQIKDNGGGIPEDILDRIFEPYFTTKHQSVGTGLGLAMVDKIIRQRHHGTIKVQNTTFNYKNQSYQGASITIVFHAT